MSTVSIVMDRAYRGNLGAGGRGALHRLGSKENALWGGPQHQ